MPKPVPFRLDHTASASGLTSAQVANIRAVTDTGRQRRVTISSQGYLCFPGLSLIVR